jgi:hypothetical protein
MTMPAHPMHPSVRMLTLLSLPLFTVMALSPAPAPASDAPAPVSAAPAPVSATPAPVAAADPARADATIHRKVLPKAAWKAIRGRRAELWVEGDRRVVRPTAERLGRLEDEAATLWVSDDAGKTWRTVTLPACGNAGCVLRLERGGALQFMTGHEAACGGGGQDRQVGHLDGREWTGAAWPWDSPLGFTLPADGWAATDCSPPKGFEGPDRVPCLVDAAGREVYLPIAWDEKVERPITIDTAAGTAEYAGRKFPLTAP